MTSDQTQPTSDEVLELFLLEDDHGPETLKRFVTDYPQFATKLIDLSTLIASGEPDDGQELSAVDQSRIDAAWVIHRSTAPTPQNDPFATLSPAQSKSLAQSLGVPRQVITGLRERKALPSTIPRKVVKSLADGLDVPMPHIIAALNMPHQAAPGRSYKSDGKPGAGGQVSFEQLLIEADVSPADRARLMSED